jgi:hypothetical protein
MESGPSFGTASRPGGVAADGRAAHPLGRIGAAEMDTVRDAADGGVARGPSAHPSSGVPSGIRTRVLALKGPRPRPLDDGDGQRQSRTQNHITPQVVGLSAGLCAGCMRLRSWAGVFEIGGAGVRRPPCLRYLLRSCSVPRCLRVDTVFSVFSVSPSSWLGASPSPACATPLTTAPKQSGRTLPFDHRGA